MKIHCSYLKNNTVAPTTAMGTGLLCLLTLGLTSSTQTNSSSATTLPTKIPPAAATVTTKASKVIFFQSTPKPQTIWNVTEAIHHFLDGYSHTVKNLHLDFYKFKVRTIQSFLDTTIPTMQDLQGDVRELIEYSNERGGGRGASGGAVLNMVKVGSEFVDAKMSVMEKKFGRHEVMNREFSLFVEQTGNHFKNFRQHFQDIFDNQILALKAPTGVSGRSGPCGGLVDLSQSTVTRLNYTVTDRQGVSCVWVIFTAVQDKIRISSLQVDGDGSLSFHYYDPATERMRQISNIGTEEVRLDHAMIFLVFSSSGARMVQTGFRLDARAAGLNIQNIPPVIKYLPDLVPDNDTAMTYIYPESGKYYKNDEHIFFISQPSQNRQISLSIADLELEVNSTGPCCDVLYAFTFSNNYNQFQFRKLYMGTFIPSMAEEIFGSPNQPVLLYFQSNSNITNKGFTINYRNK